jgi:hypothetical protein
MPDRINSVTKTIISVTRLHAHVQYPPFLLACSWKCWGSELREMMATKMATLNLNAGSCEYTSGTVQPSISVTIYTSQATYTSSVADAMKQTIHRHTSWGSEIHHHVKIDPWHWFSAVLITDIVLPWSPLVNQKAQTTQSSSYSTSNRKFNVPTFSSFCTRPSSVWSLVVHHQQLRPQESPLLFFSSKKSSYWAKQVFSPIGNNCRWPSTVR